MSKVLETEESREGLKGYLRQSSLVRWGQYSRIWDPPSVLKRFTTAFSFAVGFAISSSSSSPLRTPDNTCQPSSYTHCHMWTCCLTV